MPFQKGHQWRFEPGKSGNPNGRPKMSDTEKQAAKLARENAQRAMNRVLTLIDAQDEKLQFAAAKEVLDRAMGRPATTIAGDPDKPLNAKVTFGWKSPLTTSQDNALSPGTTEPSDGA